MRDVKGGEDGNRYRFQSSDDNFARTLGDFERLRLKSLARGVWRHSLNIQKTRMLNFKKNALGLKKMTSFSQPLVTGVVPRTHVMAPAQPRSPDVDDSASVRHASPRISNLDPGIAAAVSPVLPQNVKAHKTVLDFFDKQRRIDGGFVE